MQILLIQPKRIGDLILTAPAVGAVRRAFPRARITLLVAGASSGIAQLLDVDESLHYRYHRPNLTLWSRLATTPFDIALDFGGTARSALWTRLSGAPVRATYAKFVGEKRRGNVYTHLSNASVRNLHTTDFHLALIEEIQGQSATPPGPATSPPELHLPGSLIDDTQSLLTAHAGGHDIPYAIVHPGTARPEKYWLPARWAEVIRRLQEKNLTPVITGCDDPAERGHLNRIQQFLREITPPAPGPTFPKTVDLAGKISLPQLAALIARSDIAVGVDSAAMHLAASFRRPQVVLFGPTNPYHWRPRHENAHVLVASDPTKPTTDFTPRHHKAPMSEIPASTVLDSVNFLLR